MKGSLCSLCGFNIFNRRTIFSMDTCHFFPLHVLAIILLICCSVYKLCPTLQLPRLQLRSVLKLMSIESVMLSNHLIFCHSLLFLLSIFSSIRVFSNESDLHIRWPKYWSFSFSLSPSNEYSGLISFRID